jgi:hypothetical protein
MVRLLQLTENALRTPPPVLEEAQAMRETMDEQKLSLRDMARLLGKTLGYVTNRVDLLKMAPDVQQMVARRGDTLKHAPLIEAIEDETQRSDLIRAVVEDEISVRELKRRLNPEEDEHGITSSRSTQNGVSSHSNAGASNNGASTQDGTTRPDPIAQALQPARSFAAEAERMLKNLSLSPDYKAELRGHIEGLEKQVTRLKKLVQ